jgi:hypothetical protein
VGEEWFFSKFRGQKPRAIGSQKALSELAYRGFTAIKAGWIRQEITGVGRCQD